MPASESDRILAAGVSVTLSGGRTATLKYSLRSLKAFEDHFGSVQEALDALNGLYTGANTKKIGTIVPSLAAGLIHDGITADALYDGLADAHFMAEYLSAITEALDEAFPPAKPGPGKGESDAVSSGDASTTSPPALADTTTPSGG